MRDYGDRESKKERWDVDVASIPLGLTPIQVRLVGPVQDIAQHWCIMQAGDFADKIKDLQRKAKKDNKPFVRPQDPPGVPFMCPKFDLYREKFVDYFDPDTGQGFYKKETMSAADLKRKGVRITKAQAQDTKARYSPKSVEAEKAIPVEDACCPQHNDFKQQAGLRTWWHAFIRPKAASSRGARRGGGEETGPQDFAIIGKGGLPYTAMLHIRKISKDRQMNPADPDNGYDLIFSMDKSMPAQLMYHVKEPRGAADSNPLTSDEKKIAFGLYKLVEKDESGKNVKVNFLEILKIRREAPERLKGMKVIREAATWPLEDMAREATSADDMKEFMVQNGYYDGEGNPRPELIQADKKKGDWDDKGKEKTRTDDDAADDDSSEEKPRRRHTSSEGKRPKKPASSGTTEPPKKVKKKRPMIVDAE